MLTASERADETARRILAAISAGCNPVSMEQAFRDVLLEAFEACEEDIYEGLEGLR